MLADAGALGDLAGDALHQGFVSQLQPESMDHQGRHQLSGIRRRAGFVSRQTLGLFRIGAQARHVLLKAEGEAVHEADDIFVFRPGAVRLRVVPAFP